MGSAVRRTLDQRKGSRLSGPGRPLPAARRHPPGSVVLRGAGLPGPVRWRPALAGGHRRGRGRRLVLFLGGRAGLRLARLHADLYRRLADRGGHRRPAVEPAGRRSHRAAAQLDRAARLPGPGGRRVRPLHRHRRAGLCRDSGARRPVAACGKPSARGPSLVARVGRAVRRRRGHLRRPGSTAGRSRPDTGRAKSPSALAPSRPTSGPCPCTCSRPCPCWCWGWPG